MPTPGDLTTLIPIKRHGLSTASWLRPEKQDLMWLLCSDAWSDFSKHHPIATNLQRLYYAFIELVHYSQRLIMDFPETIEASKLITAAIEIFGIGQWTRLGPLMPCCFDKRG